VPLFLQSALGISVFIGLAWAVSEDRRAFPWRIVLAGLALQFALAAALLKLPWVSAWVSGLNEVMHALERATDAGTAFVFGYLGGGPLRSPRPCRGRASSSRSARCRSSWW
jgi:CNT family concentrative nucleoside transporter